MKEKVMAAVLLMAFSKDVVADVTWNYETFMIGDTFCAKIMPGDYSGDLKVPSFIDGYPVMEISDGAFQYCEGITSITLPDSVTYIPEGAFMGCSGLADKDGFVIVRDILADYFGDSTTVSIPTGVRRIDYGAFSCKEITSVTIPYGVTEIGGDAFSGCSELVSVSIPASVTTIPACMFYSCTSLESVLIPASVTSIGYLAFMKCSKLKKVTIACSVAPECDDRAFEEVWNAVVYVPKGSTGWDGDPASTALPFEWKGLTIRNYEVSGGYAAWVAERGLTGADAAWDAKPARWGGAWENAFVYTFGEGLSDGTIALMRLTFDSDRRPIITTAPVVQGHVDFKVKVVGTTNLKDWGNPVSLNLVGTIPTGGEWMLPDGAEAWFFRVRLSE